VRSPRFRVFGHITTVDAREYLIGHSSSIVAPEKVSNFREEVAYDLRIMGSKRITLMTALNVDRLLQVVDAIRRTEIESLIDVSHAAEIRGCSRQAIFGLMKTGRLWRYEIDGHIFVDRAEVLTLPPLSRQGVPFTYFRRKRAKRH
jgi:hypothetical protein